LVFLTWKQSTIVNSQLLMEPERTTILKESEVIPFGDQGILSNSISSLQSDLEEKLFQISQIRLVAEAMSTGLHDNDYLEKKCEAFNRIFNSEICAVYWKQEDSPDTWWLRSWDCVSPDQRPTKSILPHVKNSLLDKSWRHGRPLFYENTGEDEVLEMWRPGYPPEIPIILMPLRHRTKKTGILVLVGPTLNLSRRNIIRQMDVLFNLINSGIQNRNTYETLQQSEEEFKDLFENSSDMIIVADRNGEILDTNRVFQEKVLKNNELKRNHVEDYISDEMQLIFKASWKQLVESGTLPYEDVRIRCEDNTFLEAEVAGNVRVLPYGGGETIRLFIRDITERLEFERQKQSFELEVELAKHRRLAQVGLNVSGIAHNLQNPMQVLLGQLTLLKHKNIDPDMLRPLEDSTKHIMDIIQNLLHKMRMEHATSIHEFNINELIKSEMTFLNSNTFFKHSIEKRYSFAEKLPSVRGVYSDFSQAFMNLVYNALDAMTDSERKILGISTEYDDSECRILIKVSDSGSGISEDVKKKIFEPFFTTKGDSRDGKNGLESGSGLGLSSAQGLLKPYNGQLSFESEPGRGTTFIISVPAGRA